MNIFVTMTKEEYIKKVIDFYSNYNRLEASEDILNEVGKILSKFEINKEEKVVLTIK